MIIVINIQVRSKKSYLFVVYSAVISSIHALLSNFSVLLPSLLDSVSQSTSVSSAAARLLANVSALCCVASAVGCDNKTGTLFFDYLLDCAGL